MPDVVRIGSRIFSWESLIFTVEGLPQKGFLSLDTEEKRERKIVYGSRRDGTPVGKTAGKYGVSGSMKMLNDAWDNLTTDLSALGFGSYGDAEFTMVITAVELPEMVQVIDLVLGGVTIDGVKTAYAEGVDELAKDVTLGILWARENGKQLWSLTRGVE